MRAKYINEFTRGGNPLDTLGIGYIGKIYKFFDDLKISRDDYTIENKQIIFKDNLVLKYQVSIKEFPDNLTIHGYLNLAGCINLTKLPNNLTIDGCLHLNGCSKLEKLPDNLIIGDYLSLSGCDNLVELPNNLVVKGNIFLRDTNIVELPKDLDARGYIYVSVKQTELKNWIESSKFKKRLRI